MSGEAITNYPKKLHWQKSKRVHIRLSEDENEILEQAKDEMYIEKGLYFDAQVTDTIIHALKFYVRHRHEQRAQKTENKE